MINPRRKINIRNVFTRYYSNVIYKNLNVVILSPSYTHEKINYININVVTDCDVISLSKKYTNIE